VVAKLPAIEQPFDPDSPRERECLRWVAAGKTDREIARLLSISATTAKSYIDAARAKLGARTRAQAVARMVVSGLY
jgi:DNA-binding CsgD family transcriptional regulator